MSGGCFSDGNLLVAYLCVCPDENSEYNEGYTEYISSTDGILWSAPKPVTDSYEKPVLGIIEQDVHALPGGRFDI